MTVGELLHIVWLVFYVLGEGVSEESIAYSLSPKEMQDLLSRTLEATARMTEYLSHLDTEYVNEDGARWLLYTVYQILYPDGTEDDMLSRFESPMEASLAVHRMFAAHGAWHSMFVRVAEDASFDDAAVRRWLGEAFE